MFDLMKDVQKYKGIPPYASELFGIYQPLLGWQSKLTKKWLQKGGQIFDPRIKRILDGLIQPGPKGVANSHPLEFQVTPLQPGSGKFPYTVYAARDMNSELIKVLVPKVQAFVNGNNGNLPQGAQWLSIIDINAMMNPDTGELRQANDIIRQRLYQDAVASAGGVALTTAAVEAARKLHLELMQYESQIAAFLLFHAEAQPGYSPDALNQIFAVKIAEPLDNILKPTDPLANIDPNDKSGSLSPVGFVHIFRQYFFNLGTFLGEPVEHIWLAPGTTIELVEVSTRRTLVERVLEETLDSTTKSELSTSFKDELSDAVKEENETSTKLGVSNTNTVNFGVYQGTVSASFGIDSTRKAARETSHKQNREQSEKLSTEIKRSFKSVFKTVTETTDTRSRRHLIQNPTGKLLNYELRRKMRRVGVQLQDIGERLCWQVFIDDPAVELGLSELVDFAEAPDLSNLKEPETIPAPVNEAVKVVVPIPFIPILDYTNNRANYEYAYEEKIDSAYKGKHLSIIKGDEDDDDSQTIMGPFSFKFDPPKANYALTPDIRVLGVQGGKIAAIRQIIPNIAAGTFDIIMQRVNFGGENFINLDVQIMFAPQSAAFTDYEELKKKAREKYDAERDQAIRKAFRDSVLKRINDAASIRSRPSWDLREEERTVIYRKLIRRLMLDSWKLPDNDTNRRLSHVRSEIVRTLFDVDAMLYFVAPEWWMPRRHGGRLNLDIAEAGKTQMLSNQDLATWGSEKRDSNYKVTNDSAPAKLGSSLGWLLQLDGDNLRNAFLNAPWVKAVIPIRPGHERAALNWLRAIEGHEQDGWESNYLGASPEDAEFAGKSVGEVLETIAGRLEDRNGTIQPTLMADRVFEHGFDHLAGGFDAGLAANEIFSQWISVLPTDQIVAVEYTPTDYFTPGV
ncbi:hypothetical protein YTPLAS72_26660 [Nitrospira sp.]|nr:hypothetical protein YTPLAS72_26660 [Nitrospira sp.]